MSKIIVLIIVFIMCLYGNAFATGESILSGGGSIVNTNTDCNRTAFYGLGTLCQDTDDGKLYKGTGSGIVEVAEYIGILDNGNSGTTKTIAWLSANRQKVILTADCTFTFTAPATVRSLRLYLYQPGAPAGKLATWPATVKWAGGTAPTLTTTANALDIITCDYIGSDYECGANLDMK